MGVLAASDDIGTALFLEWNEAERVRKEKGVEKMRASLCMFISEIGFMKRIESDTKVASAVTSS